MKIAAKVLRWMGGSLLALLVIQASLAFLLLRTQQGHNLFLRAALTQAASYVNGELAVGRLTSIGLLRGFTLHDVRIADPEGRPFILVDSLRVRYSVSDLLRRHIVLVPADIWGPTVVLETLQGDAQSNVGRILGDMGASDPSPNQRLLPFAQGQGSAGFSIALRQTVLHGGELLIRLPVEEPARSGRSVYEHLEGVGAGDYRLLVFDQIEARVSVADLLGPDLDGESIRLDQLSLVGQVLEEPFVISEFRGEVSRQGPGVQLEFDRLWLPGSELSGRASIDWGTPEGVWIEVEVDADVVQFDDFKWLEPRLPSGGGRMGLRVSGPIGRSAWRVVGADVEAEVEGGVSRMLGEVGFDLTELRFTETELALRPFHLGALSAWLPEPIPFAGAITGDVRLEGVLDALQVGGEVSFEDADRGIPPSTVVWEGSLDVRDGLGASDVEVTVEPLRYETLGAFLPDLQFRGEGRARFRAQGELASNIQISGEIEHNAGAGLRSVMFVSGVVQPAEDDVNLALAATFDALSLDGIAVGMGRNLPVSGLVSGTVQATGLVSDLLLSSSLETPGGPLEASIRLDLREPYSRYRVEAALDEFRLDQITSGLPEPTAVTGELLIDGAGAGLEALRGSADLAISEALIGRAQLEGLATRLRAVDGRLVVEELELRSPLIRVSGSGDLALREDQPDGSVALTWSADSLAVLRPVLRGEEVIAADTLTQLEREVLRLEGIDPDTLGAVEQVALAGTARGELLLRGGVRDLEGEGFAELSGAVFGGSSVTRSRADLRGSWRGADDWVAEAVLDFDTLSVSTLTFAYGSGGVSFRSGGSGDFDLAIQGLDGQDYATEGAIARDSIGVGVALRSLEIQSEGEEWRMEAPSRIRFEGSSILTDGVRILGPRTSPSAGDGPASIQARGRLDREQESDLTVELSGVDLDRLSRVVQTESLPSGVIDLRFSLEGPAENPRMQSDVLIRDFALNGTALTSLEGTLRYQDLSLDIGVAAEQEGRRLLLIQGRIPTDLSFGVVEDRFPDREIDLAITVDSLPAATALAFLDVLEEVQGSLDGDVLIRGTADQPRPRGEIRLTDGGLSIPGLGLRPTALNAQLQVREDYRVEVEAQARAGGTAEVTGVITLEDLRDPEFDLQLSSAGFQAVQRRDLTAEIQGDLTLTGFYSSPQIGGTANVERGELFLEEFVRGAEVIDLSDPRFFDVVDTTLVAGRPVTELAQNEFLQNLRVDVALSLEQDFWIRSLESTQGMDLEVTGDLGLTFDRPARELRLAGNLQAVRGSYTQFGRVFDVQTGTVEFVGTPGIDPSLSIQAVHRLRREAAEPLNVLANVGGTLQAPQVTLSSDAQPPIPESDLISYLLFGRPSYALASGEVSVVEGAAAGLSTTILNLGVSQLGSTFTRSLGVDYLSVSQAQQSGGLGAFRSPTGFFADTQIEMGRYVGQNVFLAVTLRPLTGLGAFRSTQLPGARLEWRFREYWSAEGFLEDRLARQGRSAFGELDNDFARVFGVSLFRDWGY